MFLSLSLSLPSSLPKINKHVLGEDKKKKSLTNEFKTQMLINSSENSEN